MYATGPLRSKRGGSQLYAMTILAKVTVATCLAGLMAGSSSTEVQLSIVAGGAVASGPALQSPQRPFAVAAISGAVYVADGLHNLIRQVNLGSGWESTVVGGGRQNPSSRSGVRSNLIGLAGPSGVAVDSEGDLLIADSGDRQILIAVRSDVMLFGRKLQAHQVYRLAGGSQDILANPWGITTDPQDNAIFTDAQTGDVWMEAARSGLSYDQPVVAGHVYPIAARLSFPRGVAASALGIAITDTGNNRILFAPSHSETLFGQRMMVRHVYTLIDARSSPALTSFKFPEGVTWGPANSLIFADGIGNIYIRTSKAGVYYGRELGVGTYRIVAADNRIVGGLVGGLAVNSDYDLFISGQAANVIAVLANKQMSVAGRPVHPATLLALAGNGTIDFGGEGQLASNAYLSAPAGLASLASGGVVIADSGNNRVRVIPSSSGMVYGRRLTAGHIYTILGNGSVAVPINGLHGTQVPIGDPLAVATDDHDDVFVLSGFSNQLFVVAAHDGYLLGRRLLAGRVYVIAGRESTSGGFSGDGGPATLATLSGVSAVGVGANGIAIADSSNGRIRYIALSSGIQFSMKMTQGDIYTVAGDGARSPKVESEVLGVDAPLADPRGLAWDQGDLVITDTGNNVIQVLAGRRQDWLGRSFLSGYLYLVAGDGRAGYSASGTAALGSQFFLPSAVTVDEGNILVADSQNNRIRVLAGRAGSYYGLKLRVNRVYTVAGSGINGSCSVSAVPLKSDFTDPTGIAAAADRVWVSNTGEDQVCEVVN